ncbi:hypothetical protein FRB91_007106 [Serendipita sp. 411]|nr:hypothetical protein FRC18_003409 [Serendipita sp. 400]KAG8852011.1 hypothetical protein FRB91_007106 [Serendipita sp. 411]
MSAIIKRSVPLVAGLTSVRARTVAVVGARFYSQDGATARDPGWSKKEKAIEDQHAHNREVETIKKLREQLAKQQKELEEREKKLEEMKKPE